MVQWCGEGFGQLISLILTSSRQLAGGVIALVLTVLTGSFPLLSGLGEAFQVISYFSFVRWGMVAMYSVELMPWAYGNLDPISPNVAGCCPLSPELLQGVLDGVATLPVQCPGYSRPMPGSPPPTCTGQLPPLGPLSGPHLPNSCTNVEILLAETYGYKVNGLSMCSANSGKADVYPPVRPATGAICGFPSFAAGFSSMDPGFSQPALTCLLIIGVSVRILVYASLRLTDRARRR